MDDDNADLLVRCAVVILLGLCVIVFAGWAWAARPVVIVTDAGEITGRFMGAELGEPITVVVDTSAVFSSGFEE